MKYILAMIFAAFSIILTAQNPADTYLVTDLNNISEISINTGQLNLLAKEYGQTASFTELKVQKLSGHYVLLAKDITQKWIYAFELKTTGTKLYIDLNKHISACESETLSLNIFNITEGEIDGCIKSEHHVLGRN